MLDEDTRMGIASTLADIADRLTVGNVADALACAHTHIPPARAGITITHTMATGFDVDQHATRAERPVRALSKPERLAIWRRDGFVDRYSPERWRLVHPGALRVLSLHLGGAMPTYLSANLPRSPAENTALWFDVWPTVDHIVPRATFGTNDDANLVCCSWWRNAAKGERTLSATGWSLQEPGSLGDWDGLSAWFHAQLVQHSWLEKDAFVASWNVTPASLTSEDATPEGVRGAMAPITGAATQPRSADEQARKRTAATTAVTSP